jgi:hypothetical protein
VYENPDPSLSDPEWAMAVGLQEWTGTRRCIRCGVSEYQNPKMVGPDRPGRVSACGASPGSTRQRPA